jgi:hypothetical protein
VVDRGQAGESLGEPVDFYHRHGVRLVSSWGWVGWSMTTMVAAQARCAVGRGAVCQLRRWA